MLRLHSPGSAASYKPRRPCRLLAAASLLDSLPLPAAHLTEITSTSNPYVVHAVKLRTSRAYREVAGTLLLPGDTVLSELACHGLRARVLLLAHGAEPPAGLLAERTLAAAPAVLRRVSGLESADSLSCVAELFAPAFHAPSAAAQTVLLLDGLQEPGNVGTLIRTATALGFAACALLPGTADAFSAKAVRASRGASLRLPLWRPSWAQLRTFADDCGAVCLAADAAGAPQAAQAAAAEAAARRVPLWLALGAEGGGLSADARELCALCSVPGAGGMESLNVAAAGAILMHLVTSRAGAGAGEQTMQQKLSNRT